jgi:hypothetical protein
LFRGWRNKQAFDAITNQLRNAGHEGADAGNFHRHGFHQRYGQSFGEACENKNVRSRQPLPGDLVTERTFEDHGGVDVFTPDKRLQPTAPVAVADKPQPQVVSTPQKLGEGTKKNEVTLGRDHPANADDFYCADSLHGRIRHEDTVIDAEPHDVQLGPMLRIADLHHLAAAIIADAEDELSPFHFAPQVELVDVVELFGAVNHQGVGELPRHRRQHTDGGHRASEVNMQMCMSAAPQPISQ